MPAQPSSPHPPRDVIRGHFGFGIREELVGRGELFHAAEVEEGGAVGDAAGLLDVVGDDDDGVALLELQDEFLDSRGGDGVERGAGFGFTEMVRAMQGRFLIGNAPPPDYDEIKLMALPPFGSNGLLPDGIHSASEGELRSRGVNEFSSSVTRPDIFERFCAYRSRLAALGIHATQWVDGSFVDAARVDPDDIDVVNFCDSTQINALSPEFRARAALLLSGGKPINESFRTHAFLVQIFPAGHPFANRLEERLRYWAMLFKTPQDHSGVEKRPAPERGAKGIAQMTVGDPAKAPIIPQPARP